MGRCATGFIIELEGIDGSGKTMYAEMVADELHKRGFSVQVISFPDYGGFFGAEIGRMLSGSGDVSADTIDAKSMALWYASDRRHTLGNIELDADYIIFNRYVMSNAVYQGARSGQAGFDEWVYQLEYEINGLPKPNISFVFDVDIEISNANVLKKTARDYVGGEKKLDVYESADGLLEKARELYVKHTNERENTFLITSRDMEQVKNELIRRILGEQ
jgi:dTMP kinase